MTNVERHIYEAHVGHRLGWLRASVLGANDGLLSLASLLVGVTAAGASHSIVLLTGVSALLAGTLSMSAGEYVSVASQADAEAADIAIERQAIEHDPDAERIELADIYEKRGLPRTLANEVAEVLTAQNALDAHVRDELGITETLKARPIQAALASGASFLIGGVLPLFAAVFAPTAFAHLVVAFASILGLICLGVFSAIAGGAPVIQSVLRMSILGAGAMAATGFIGALLGSPLSG